MNSGLSNNDDNKKLISEALLPLSGLLGLEIVPIPGNEKSNCSL